METFTELTDKVIANIETVIVGKRDAIKLALVALLAEGHILLEDVPGVAKTLLAKSLAISIGGGFRRVQCTPDLLPSDVTGVSVFNQKTVEFEFRPGPVFTTILLADEINRATPRTQASLLECMAERQVTVDNQTRQLPDPFMVIATQNPIEHEGTFPLPEAELDRFLVRLSIGYPEARHELEILKRTEKVHPLSALQPVITTEDLRALQHYVKTIFVHDHVRKYIVDLVAATRETKQLILGASPRASMALFRTSQALAAFDKRTYVLPDDVKTMLHAVVEHRVILNPESRLRNLTVSRVVYDLVNKIRVPAGTPYYQ